MCVDIVYAYDIMCIGSAIKYGRTVALQSGSTSPVYIDGKLCRFVREEFVYDIDFI